MIDRTISPAFKQVEHIELIKPQSLSFDNGLKGFSFSAGDQELVRIELMFKNINWDSTKPLQAVVTNTMLNDGTSKLTASEIAEKVDYYGAFLQTDYSNDYSTVTLYSLNKHLAATLPVLKAVITDSIFPQVELETFVRNQKQKLTVSLEKNDFVSRRIFNNTLFGETRYGYTIEAKDYGALRREDLVDYFQKAYQPKNCTLIVSGKVEDDCIHLLNRFFGQDWDLNFEITQDSFKFTPPNGTEHYTEKPQALQSALRIGQVMINRTHPDFPGLQILNTILGGYFGSRLMTNIREDKGYTYGIGSALVSLGQAGYFFIASEVGAEVCSDAINEIKKEVDRLRNEPVSEQELSLVRNYMLGSMLGDLENIFSHADKFKSIYFGGLGYDYFDRYIETVKNITAKKLQELANQYLDFDKFEKVIVGKK
jgi:zinc protease